MLRILSNTIVTLIFGVTILQCATSFDEAQTKQKTIVIFKEFKGELQGELIKAVNERGAENSIEVCAKISPEIEAKISKNKGFSMKRISDKNRNPLHAPDEFEAKILDEWKASLAKGDKPAVYTQRVGNEFRVLNPIMIDNPTCLQCHGNEKDIKPETLEKIQLNYPNDKAKGYKLGELRGAMSGTWKI
ncbi:Tll0287-like domain-containing protein [Leptospira sp. GIMC2001]|uniref:Tll0287-like domain-containing protein n=1 Tax=Leptospira sp. GIMC2001 TaxID=1513297 RepID=UPI0023492175|nr:DUF3365 domain-containing protein [Leptospira sp. GIMC2001]WCL49497.1 DUF3365 domain-containing protein [Leptospira sp. GIMC2001]